MYNDYIPRSFAVRDSFRFALGDFAQAVLAEKTGDPLGGGHRARAFDMLAAHAHFINSCDEVGDARSLNIARILLYTAEDAAGDFVREGGIDKLAVMCADPFDYSALLEKSFNFVLFDYD